MVDRRPQVLGHVHIYKNSKKLAKIVVPKIRVLSEKINQKLKKIIQELLREGKI